MTKDCSLNYKFSTWKLKAQNMLRICREHFLFVNFSECQNKNKKQFVYTTCSQHVLSLQFPCTELNLLFNLFTVGWTCSPLVLFFHGESVNESPFRFCHPLFGIGGLFKGREEKSKSVFWVFQMERSPVLGLFWMGHGLGLVDPLKLLISLL